MAAYRVLPTEDNSCLPNNVECDSRENDSMDDSDDCRPTRRLVTSNPSIRRIEGGASTNGHSKAVVIRNLFGFWLLGLCNNYAYVIMLSAAHDILDDGDTGGTNHTSNSSGTSTGFCPERDCNPISAGAILLANIIPSLAVKLVAPFVLSFTYLQIAIAIITAFLSYLLVSFSVAHWMAFTGVVCASISSGLGEVTLLRYSTGFENNVVSTWSSGTGASGVLGAFTYAAFTTAGLTPRNTLLLMLIVPVLMAVTFCFLLVHPSKMRALKDLNGGQAVPQHAVEVPDYTTPLSFARKISLIRPLIKYMVPLSLVYLFEYFINQGLLELVYIKNTFLSHAEQYRWYQVDYQIGVFISRSSVNIVQIDKLWLLPVLQCVNAVVFLFEAYYLFIPSVWLVFAFILFEGLLGGSSYVNTFYKITQEVDEPDREYSMGAASMSDSFGITIAGAISIPVHSLLCSVPIP